MEKNKKNRDSLPERFESIEEAADFWDKHSLADYEDLQHDIDFEVDMKREKNYFAIERDLSAAISKTAKSKGILPETLINLWLKEKLMQLN
jgi:hypothetical protein